MQGIGIPQVVPTRRENDGCSRIEFESFFLFFFFVDTAHVGFSTSNEKKKKTRKSNYYTKNTYTSSSTAFHVVSAEKKRVFFFVYKKKESKRCDGSPVFEFFARAYCVSFSLLFFVFIREPERTSFSYSDRFYLSHDDCRRLATTFLPQVIWKLSPADTVTTFDIRAGGGEKKRNYSERMSFVRTMLFTVVRSADSFVGKQHDR